MQTSSQYAFASLTAAQNIAYVTSHGKPAMTAYLAAGGLKPVVVEASLGGEKVSRLASSDGFPLLSLTPCTTACLRPGHAPLRAG